MVLGKLVKIFREAELQAAGRSAVEVRGAERAGIFGGTSGLNIFETGFLEFGLPAHTSILVCSGGDDWFRARFYMEKARGKVIIFRASPEPLGGSFRLAERLFNAQRDLVRSFLSSFLSQYNVLNAVLSSMGATSFYALLITRESIELAKRTLLVDFRLPVDTPLTMYVRNIREMLEKLRDVQREAAQKGTAVVISPYVAPRSLDGRRDIAEYRFLRDSAIITREDWGNILRSFFSQEEGQEGLVVTLPILIRGRSEEELLSRAQRLTLGSTESFRADCLSLEPLEDNINIVAAVTGPVQEKHYLDSLAAEIIGLLSVSLMQQLGIEGSPRELPTGVPGSWWRAAILLGPWRLKAVKIGEEQVRVSPR